MTGQRLALPLLLLSALCAPLSAAEDPAAVGSKVGNLSFTDIRYTQRSLDDFGRPKATVFLFTQTGCPLVPKYLAVLDALERDYRGKGVQFVAVNVGPNDTVVDMAAQAVEFGAGFPFVKDFDGHVLDALGARRTPEVVVLDAERRIRYRGRIDDQFRPGGNLPKPTRRDLKEALDELLAGKDVSV